MRVSYRMNGVIMSQKDYEIHLAKFKSSDNWLLCKIRNLKGDSLKSRT